ncbi:S-formylglutathione hydrolase FrmB [Kitasatospora atroaurantiaca]|uniref:S-formylglutathione hydrolase FrmB n=1 Tax=Kitasatospora atroaurantiaca TaxID=285545 RepID=A0A561EPN4_9ACTN|nr:S-formylglutathione hydrolase FrmB [Kitasatospora atroaurantiaca]
MCKYDHRVNVSLLHGWFPLSMKVLAVLALLVTIAWRDRVWRLRRLPLALAAATLLTVLVALSVVYLSGNTDPLPIGLWLWIGVGLAAVAVLVAGWRGNKWWQWVAGPVALVLAFVTAANALNIYTGYYPTVNDAIGELTGEPLPDQVPFAQLGSVTGETRKGRVISVTIPSTKSGFTHRRELVYLPPIWFRSAQRPKLPVMMMIGGEYSTPENWVRTGHAVETADAYAAKHDGFAPILVFPDATGGFKNDTECVNGPAGNSEDHLVKDVPPFIIKTFGTAADSRKWGVGGWSMGGTCALTLVVTHPGLFGHFFDVSGDTRPNLGGRKQSVEQLFGGDAAAYDAHDPITAMARHGQYKNVSGWFEIADGEPQRLPTTKKLEEAANQAGITTRMTVQHGGHTWQFGADAFKRALPWLTQQLTTAGGQTGTPSAAPTP